MPGTDYNLAFNNMHKLEIYVGGWKVSTAVIGVNDWSFVMITIASSSLNLYVNGSSVKTTASSSSAITSINFGARSDALNPPYGYIGLLDEIRLYNFALSAQQETNLYQYYENILNGV